jgi:multiple sugar transport system substrate-binding protein
MAIKILQLMLVTITLMGSSPGCKHEPKVERAPGETTIVFKHGKIAGDAAAFRRLLDRFEQEHPRIRVRDEALPASTDEQHQFYAVNLESGSRDFDVLALDVIWVPEFARAGWLRDLTHLFAPGEQEAFFPGPIQAVTYDSRLYAIPWYIDAGVLYVRTDLLKKHNKRVPKTWQELVVTAQEIVKREPGIYGYLWQGKQYEGLVCNVLEFIWSNGGEVLRDGKPVIDGRENREALGFMRDLIARYGITPPLVTTAIEEPTRQLFGSGRVLFMRNWPYAWSIFNSGTSPVRGKVGLSPLPAFAGHESVSTLGGWQLGVNAFSLHPEAGEKLVLFLTSPAAQKELARTVGYKPSRKDLYKDRDLLREQGDLGQLFTIFMQARPRPVTPYYMMITGVLQPEFSAVIAGIRKPEEALASAQKQVEHLLEAGR